MQASTDSSSDEDFDTNQLYIHKTSRNHTDKLTTVLTMGGVNIEVEVDTEAEVSTMPIAIYRQKFSHVPLSPSTVRLHQYDGTMLPTKGEVEVVATENQQSITGKFVIVDITNDQLPLLSKDCLLKLRLDWPKLLVYSSIQMVDNTALKTEFPDVLRKS